MVGRSTYGILMVTVWSHSKPSGSETEVCSQSSHDEKPNKHQNSLGDRHEPMANFVHQEKGWDGHDNVQNILNGT